MGRSGCASAALPGLAGPGRAMGHSVTSVPSFDADGSHREPVPHPRAMAPTSDDHLPALGGSLGAIAAAFERRLPDETLRALVNTRVLLRTGVNLRAVAAGDRAHPDDPAIASAVLTALEQLGYHLHPGSE